MVLWKNDKRIIAILVFFILVTTGTDNGSLKTTFVAHLRLSIAAAAVCSMCFGIIDGGGTSIFGFRLSEVDFETILVVPTLGTNLLSTGLISWKAWCALLVFDPRHLSLTVLLA